MTDMKSLEDIIDKPRPDFNQLLKVLKRDGKPSYVPYYELFVKPDVMEKILGKKVPDTVSTVEFYYKAGYDYVPAGPTFDMKTGSLSGDTSCNYPIMDWEDFEKYDWPDPSSITYPNFEALIPILPKGMKIIGQFWGIFEIAQMLMGYSNLCMKLYDDPELVEAVFERLGAIYESMYKGMAAFEQTGALVISDDMGFNTQTLISAEDLRKFVLPRHKKLAEIAHNAGKPCILHSCGQLSLIMDDIIDYVGIDAKQSYQDNILPVDRAKELYGDRIAILGGIDIDRLCRSTEEEIRNYTEMLLQKLGSDGGYALGSGNSIAWYMPVSNYLAILDVGWKARSM